MPNVPQCCTGSDNSECFVKTFLSNLHQSIGVASDLANPEHDARIAVPAILNDGDIDIDDVSDESDIEVKSELPGESADVSAILGLLTKAQDKAEGMGDEKLMDQIGNTITYYTRTHVVAEDARTDAEEEGYKDGMKDEKEDLKKEELNEEFARFKKLAGLI